MISAILDRFANISAYFSKPPQSSLGDRRLIVSPKMLAESHGADLNGPSLIRAPDWLRDRLGNYYLYFSHHNGDYIRLAYADSLDGPWKIYEPGTLRLDQATGCKGHIASPDVIVDHARQKIVMYFHGPAKAGGGQKTFIAESDDGLKFSASGTPIGIFYFRVFQYGPAWYGMAKGGLVYKSPNGLTGWQKGKDTFPVMRKNAAYNKSGSVRHVAVEVVDDVATVYFSRIGDRPERLLRGTIDLAADWLTWKVENIEEIARPVEEWEGAKLRIKASIAGVAREPVHELRDPAFFHDDDGSRHLLYSVAGERGIAMARL